MTDDLIARLEKATGPDRGLDSHIYLFANGGFKASYGRSVFSQNLEKWCDSGEINRVADNYEIPRYTASIDAALTLVPEGLDYVLRSLRDRAEARVGGAKNEYRIHGGQHPIPAIALCIAALRSRDHGGAA